MKNKMPTDALSNLIQNPRQPCIVETVGTSLQVRPLDASCDQPVANCYHLPPIYPEWLGDRQFTHDHHIRFPYIVGEMARGIATPKMVIAAAEAGLLGFYGSAGLQVDEIRKGLAEIRKGLDNEAAAWGANIIHTPQQPGYEAEVIDLFVEQSVRRVSASAYMRLSSEIVRYTCLGLTQAANGEIIRHNHVFAKVSRAEVAEQFMAPAPKKILDQLLQSGRISAEQARLGAQVPVAAEITAEADSGGHTDNRPACVVFSSLAQARARISERWSYPLNTIRIGLAGGIATPQAVASAFQMGAAYVLTGSVNQSAVESGLSLAGRQSLAGAGPADVMMAPAADMFEQGVKVQVLKRGTLFAMRGERLYAMYRAGAQFETLPGKDKAWVESVLGEPFEAAWQATRTYLSRINPDSVAKADQDGNKKFALVCRRYLFLGAQWAREGVEDRKSDFQIWCGPAMGAFNEWVKDTPLEPLVARTVKQIAWNLLEGGAVLTRAAQLRSVGVAVPAEMFSFSPRVYT